MLEVWNYLIGASPLMMLGILKLSLSTPFFKSINDEIKSLRSKIKENSEYVGREFPDVARKIHYDEEKSRSIYGEASLEDVKDLRDEGIDIIQIPDAPDEKN